MEEIGFGLEVFFFFFFCRGKGSLGGRKLGWGCSMGWIGLRFVRPKKTRGPTILIVCLKSSS